MTPRLATTADAAQIAAIYRPFCGDSHVSFETKPPDAAEMAARIEKITRQFPWLVAETESTVISGYVYASPHRERAAYRWSTDVAVYIHPDFRGKGVGRTLYTALFSLLRRQNYFKAYAGIALPNPGSVALHRSMGFTPVGVFERTGFKAGAWHDVAWWQFALQPEQTPPPEPRSIHSLLAAEDCPEIQRSSSPPTAAVR